MQNLLHDLTTHFAKEDKYISEGKLLKNVIVEDALKLEPSLLKLLLKNKSIKKHFFQEIEGIYVFDKIKFQKFISNKEFLPDSYTAFKNKIGLTIADEFITEKKDVVLSWPYKDCILEGGQDKEDAKRDEIFWNETLAPDEIDRLLSPKVLTNWKKYDKDGEHKVFDFSVTDNLVIKGNNLLGLSSILKKYRGKVKLIYIDPPYNTGSDSFKYNDNFNHSTWLTFMRNRLQLAKDILSNDGFIFVQCDDNEQAYLQVLMDDVFGYDNHRSNIYVETVYADKTLKQDRVFHDQIEHILVYSKSTASKIKQTLDEYSYDKFCWSIRENKSPKEVIELGGKRVEIFTNDSFEIIKTEPCENGLKEIWASGTILDMNSSGRFFRDNLMGRYDKDGYNILYKVFGIGDDGNDYRYFTGPKKIGATKGKYYQGVPLDKKDIDDKNIKKVSIENFWAMAGDFGNCRTEGGVEFKSGKKPEKLLSRIIEMTTEPEEIVLDFFAGSGTTLAVCHKMERQYIGIEQMNYDNNDVEQRIKNVINGDQTGISKSENWKSGGSFIYCELAKANQEYIDLINKAKDTKAIQKIWKNMQEKAFISYKIDIKAINENVSEFEKLSLEDQKRFLIETLDKNMLYVPYSEIDDADYQITEEDKKLNHKFYGGKA